MRGKGRKPIELHHESAWADGTPEYAAWCRMIARCENPARDAFAHYGGRGIRVCERWRKSYLAFLDDVGRRPSAGHSLDRIDVDGHYEPGNVRWATKTEQMRNTRANRWVTVRGERLTLAEAIERFSTVPRKVVEARLKNGWDVEAAIVTPLQSRGHRVPDDRRARIVEMRRAGASLVSIAAELGLTTRTVGVIARKEMACTGER